MKVTKLKNGKYRIRPMINGEQRCFTFDFRPTKADIDKIIGDNSRTGKTGVYESIDRYIDTKESVLSPSTIKMYRAYLRNMPEWFLRLRLSEVDSYKCQTLCNEIMKNHSVKYARNIYALVTATLALFAPSTSVRVTFPRQTPKGDYKPSNEDIKRILEESKGTMFEVALWLACLGLRRSEQICLTEEDLQGNVLTISKAKVQDNSNTWITKDLTKTAASVRKIILPDYVVELIHEKGFYQGHPNSIVCWLYKAQKRLGIPQFSLHYFRHYFASKVATITDEATALYLGGWKTDYVYKNTYRYALPENVEKAKADASELIKNLI